MSDGRARVGPGPRLGMHLAWWTCGLVLLPIVAFYIGLSVYDAECSGDGECDLVGLAGLVWAVIAFALALMVGVTLEVVLLVRRRRSDRK